MDYISIIFLEYHYQRELLYSTEPFFVNIFFVSSTHGGTGEKRGEQEEDGGGEEKLIHGELPFKHTSLLKTKDLISSDPDSFRFALEKIAAHRRKVPL